MNRKAFTLVELCVVMGIMSVTAAIVIPAVVSVQKSARKSGCMNNLRELTRGVVMWSFENNDGLPKEDRNIPLNLITPNYFRGDSFDQLGIPGELFKCPQNPVFFSRPSATWHGSMYEFGIPNYQTSYFYLANADGTDSDSYENPDLKKKRKHRPRNSRDGRVPIFADIVMWDDYNDEWVINHQKEPGKSPITLVGANIAFLDGHASWKHKGWFPLKLMNLGVEGNSNAVHDPVHANFRHKYWW